MDSPVVAIYNQSQTLPLGFKIPHDVTLPCCLFLLLAPSLLPHSGSGHFKHLSFLWLSMPVLSQDRHPVTWARHAFPPSPKSRVLILTARGGCFSPSTVHFPHEGNFLCALTGPSCSFLIVTFGACAWIQESYPAQVQLRLSFADSAFCGSFLNISESHSSHWSMEKCATISLYLYLESVYRVISSQYM